MMKHKEIYSKALQLDHYYCEMCFAPAQDIHHIYCKGMGGSKKKDYIENLMALCRRCHIEYGDKKQHYSLLTETHKHFLTSNGVEYDHDIAELIKKH